MSKLFWEDIRVPEVREYGRTTVTREDILRFARAYDPQPFHVDEAFARDHFYGGLIASGWHTAAICMRMMVDHMLNGAASMGSPGVERLRWRHPVRPGDTLHVRQETLSKRRSASRRDLGLVKNRFQLLNQNDEVAMEMESTGLFAVRDPQGGE